MAKVTAGEYNSTPPSLEDKQTANTQMDQSGNQKFTLGTGLNKTDDEVTVHQAYEQSATHSPSNFQDFSGSNVSTVVSSTPANVFTIQCTNANASIRYLQIHDGNSALSGGETPILSLPIPISGGALTLGPAELTQAGKRCANGFIWAFSTSLSTYTPATAAEHTISGQYAN